jgi:hypothetical protein
MSLSPESPLSIRTPLPPERVNQDEPEWEIRRRIETEDRRD